jgi:hypothetical protein
MYRYMKATVYGWLVNTFIADLTPLVLRHYRNIKQKSHSEPKNHIIIDSGIYSIVKVTVS